MDGRRAFALIALTLVAAAPASAQLQGRVEQHSFVGPVLGDTVYFNIYLPPGYDTSTELYPVIYYLHGLDGTQGGQSNTVVPQSFESARAAGVIGPVIIVFANGYLDAFWADSFDGAKPAETDVIQQLIPHVDANFRTAGTGGTRAVIGFSMGGFGAPKFYAKFPQHFAACVTYDGALSDWDDVVALRPDLAAAIFGNNQAYFQQYSPWYWAAVNAPVLALRDDLRMVVALNVQWNTQYRNFLGSLGISADYVTTGCPHAMPCMLAAEGLNSAAFIAARLDPVSSLLGDLDCDADVDFFDIDPLVLALGGEQAYRAQRPNCRWLNADCNGDGGVNFFDIDPFVARLGTAHP